MVAFFRRIRRKLFEEGRLKKYLTYALGEALLIMVGILLALQVNTWNQNRLDARQEKQLLGALSEEMTLNRFRYEQGKKRQDDITGAVEQLLLAIHNPTARPSTEQLDQAIEKLMERWFLTTSTSTYDVLVGSGQLGLLSSVELRNELALLKLQMELLGKYEAIQAVFVDEQLSPFLTGSMDRLSRAVEDLELSGSIPESRFTTSYEELYGSREFSNLLVDLLRHTRGVLLVYGNVERAMSRIDSLVVGS